MADGWVYNPSLTARWQTERASTSIRSPGSGYYINRWVRIEPRLHDSVEPFPSAQSALDQTFQQHVRVPVAERVVPHS